MKTIKILIALISFIAFSYAGEQTINNDNKIKNDLTELKLKGKVKTLTETGFWAIDKFGEIQNGDIIEKNTLIFNEKGIIIEKKWNKQKGWGIESEDKYKYDDKGNLIEVNKFNTEGKFCHKWMYKYDDKGNKIYKEEYYDTGSLANKFMYKYDDKGNEIEMDDLAYNCSHPNYAKYIYKCDEKGNQIEEYDYDQGKQEWYHKYTFEYDNKGNKIEINYYSYTISGGWLNEKDTCMYDDNSNKIEIDKTFYSPGGSILNNKDTCKYKHDYDKTGNWTKETEFKNDNPQIITEREITYYN
jgi:hypothetical protein